jgi:hypothetical protein
MQLSKFALEQMGYSKFSSDRCLTVSYSSLIVYHINGIEVEAALAPTTNGIIDGLQYAHVITTDINKGSEELFNDIFCEEDDLVNWKKEKEAGGPYLLVRVGPTKNFTCSEGYIKPEDDGSLTTYDCFRDARREIRIICETILPRIITALTCTMSNENQIVTFKLIERSLLGHSTAGEKINDFHYSSQFTLTTPIKMPPLLLAEKINVATTFATTLNSQSCHFFDLGVAEKDLLKRFLFLFLAIEIETNEKFKLIGINNFYDLNKGNIKNRNIGFKNQTRSAKKLDHLSNKFIWSAAYMWPHLNVNDIKIFRDLKSVRDDIAHGNISVPPPNAPFQVELLIRSLYSHPHDDYS